jgi:hypothetical protein
MKATIRKTKSANAPTVVALSVSLIVCVALASPAMDPVSGAGSSSAINAFQFEGTATLVIRGQEEPANLLVTVLEPPSISDEGVQHVVATHTFTLADGSITTSDMEIAEPTATPGLYTLNANMEVISGTGVYEGVCGHLTAHGTIDFRALPSAEFEVTGSISHVE